MLNESIKEFQETLKIDPVMLKPTLISEWLITEKDYLMKLSRLTTGL